MPYPIHTTPDGVKHLEVDWLDVDGPVVTKACHDMFPESQKLEVTCPSCISGIVESLRDNLMAARHHLAKLDPQRWDCVEGCLYCTMEQDPF